MRAFAMTFVVGLAATIAVAAAQEQAIALKPGRGLDTVQANCNACHSLDYIQMNSRS